MSKREVIKDFDWKDSIFYSLAISKKDDLGKVIDDRLIPEN